MISKEAFINTMKRLENLDTKMARVDSALKDLCEDFCGFYITDILILLLICSKKCSMTKKNGLVTLCLKRIGCMDLKLEM